MSYEREDLEFLVHRWQTLGRPALDRTAALLVQFDGVAYGRLEGVIVRLLTAILSADAELMKDWTTGTDAQRIHAVRQAFDRMVTMLESRTFEVEAKQRQR
jgi:hypothetical protein